MRTAPRVGRGTQIIWIWNHFRFFQPPEIADAIERLGFRTGSGDDQVGEVGQRVAQMIQRERGKFDVLAEKFGDRRPVVVQGDLGPGRCGRGQVVAPDPAAEPQIAVAGVLARLPGDGARGSNTCTRLAIW
jgi:hypothetical protein